MKGQLSRAFAAYWRSAHQGTVLEFFILFWVPSVAVFFGVNALIASLIR